MEMFQNGDDLFNTLITKLSMKTQPKRLERDHTRKLSSSNSCKGVLLMGVFLYGVQ